MPFKTQKCSGSIFVPRSLCAQTCRALLDVIKNEIFNFIAAFSQVTHGSSKQVAEGILEKLGLVFFPPSKVKRAVGGTLQKIAELLQESLSSSVHLSTG